MSCGIDYHTKISNGIVQQKYLLERYHDNHYQLIAQPDVIAHWVLGIGIWVLHNPEMTEKHSNAMFNDHDDLTDVTLADEDNNSIQTDNANMAKENVNECK